MLKLTFPDYLGTTCDAITEALPNQDNIGAIRGEAAVSGGSAGYSIPIQAAPGRRGLEPSISLSYGSGAGTGISGTGWGVAGLSRISRCDQTVAQDGRYRRISYSTEDRFCLDGQRLFVTSGWYGADGSTYRTELESFRRVTLRGAAFDLNSYFEVESKDGLVSYYGAYGGSSNAIETARGLVPAVWWIRSLRDRQSNSVGFDYQMLGGQFLPEKIEYTGTGATRGDRRIRFEFETRPDPTTTYHLTSASPNTQRLKAITSEVGAQVVRRYELAYATSRATGRSLLTSVTECTATPCSTTNSLPPTTFKYQDAPATYSTIDFPNGATQLASMKPGADFDGDGQIEVFRSLRAEPWGGALTETRVFFSSGLSEDITGGVWSDGFERIIHASGNSDLDADGRADWFGTRNGMFVVRSRGGEIGTDLPAPDGSSGILGDLDGSGLVDLLLYDAGNWTIHFQCPRLSDGRFSFCRHQPFPLPADMSPKSLQDFDGDGNVDILVDWSGAQPEPSKRTPPMSARIAFTRLVPGGVTFDFHEFGDPWLQGPSGSLAEKSDRGIGDFNGDGLSDLYHLRDVNGATELDVYVNNGWPFGVATNLGPIAIDRRHRDDVKVVDQDGDGRDELMIPTRLKSPWCYLDAPDTEPLDYCSTLGAANNFTTSGAPHHLDHSIYEWDAVDIEEGSTGLQQVRRTTTLEFPLGRGHLSDYFGDGLTDAAFPTANLYRVATGPTPVGGTPPVPVPLGRYVGSFQSTNQLGWRISRNQGPTPDLMTEVKDGLDVTTTWSYASLSSTGVAGCTSPAGLPFYKANYAAVADGEHFLFNSSMVVAARMEQSNGIGGNNATCYRYEDAMANNRGRGFLGFRKIVEEQAIGDGADLRTTRTYRQQFPFLGVEEDSQIHLASDPTTALPLERQESEWRTNCVNDADPATPGQYCFNYPYRTVATKRDLSTRQILGTTTTINGFNPGNDLAYGNMSLQTATTDDSTTRHVASTSYVYDYSDVASWWIGKLTREETSVSSVEYLVSPTMALASAPENSPKAQVVTHSYYPANHATWARLALTDNIQPGSPTEQSSVTVSSYDAYGNPLTKTVTGVGASGRTEAITYTTDGYFPASTTNAMGHVSRLTVDPETGSPLTQTDANGLVTTATYDAFGRQLTGLAPGQRTMNQRTVSCANSGDCPALAKMKTVVQRDGSPKQERFLDQLGRVVEERLTAFQSSQKVITARAFDRRGRMIRQSEPSFTLGGQYFTEWKNFDALGRPGQKIVDRSGFTDRLGRSDPSFLTEYFYNGLETDIVIEGRINASRTYNIRNQLIETVDPQGFRTQYRYDGNGKPILIQDTAGNQLRNQFDSLGRKVAAADPDRGNWSFVYNGIGQMTRQTDGNGIATSYLYDVLGRPTDRRVSLVTEAKWSYDVSGKGLLHEEWRLDSAGAKVHSKVVSYDPVKRPIKTAVSFGGATYEVEQAYNCYGSVRGLEYPNGEAIELEYTPYGYLRLERDPLTVLASQGVYREVLKENARGQIEDERFGNGLFGHYEFHGPTGQMKRSCVGRDSMCTDARQDLYYEYQDGFGNLTKRSKKLPVGSAVTFVSEDLFYDDLQRLDSTTRTWVGGGLAPVTVDYAYDALGNLTLKNDYSSLTTFGAAGRRNSATAGPHAILSFQRIAGGVVSDFSYDGNGNQIAGDGRVLTYTHFNKPKTITQSGMTTIFRYGAGDDRYQQDAPGEVTKYVEGVYEELTSGGFTTQKAYLGGSVIVSRSGGTRTIKYLHTDRSASLETVTDALGNLVESHAFDPFGMPRNSRWESQQGLLHSGEYTSEATTRGFTGHEHLDLHRLIHMGGRAYDPALGRFLSVDPVITNPANAQTLNPYTYVLNNPLAGLDPSGYEDRFTVKRQILETTAASELGPAGTTLQRFTIKDSTDGKTYTLTVSMANGAVSLETNGQKVDLSNTNSASRREVAKYKNLGRQLYVASRAARQRAEGYPAEERTKHLLAGHGTVLAAGPVVMAVGAEVLGAASYKLLQQFLVTRAGQFLAQSGPDLIAGVLGFPQGALPAMPVAVGAGGAMMANVADELADDVVRVAGSAGERLAAKAGAEYSRFVDGGGVLGSVDTDGVLTFAIERGKSVSGSELFSGMMESIGSRVTSIQGNWTYGTNLARVNELTASGVPLSQAVQQTWTAGRAKAFGFGQAAVEVAEGGPGAYQRVVARFSR
ncbi:MAG: hypothetical protein IPG45_33635 [Deltaproteobacteria bacterium]|nr:hypothetical protein [Deltaproteobacteria bacterium]